MTVPSFLKEERRVRVLDSLNFWGGQYTGRRGWCKVQTHVLWLVIAVDGDGRLAASYGHLDGSNLRLEPAGLFSGNGLFVGPNAVLVLVLATEAVVVCTLLALQAHVLLLVCVGEAVLEHAVDQRLVAKLCTVPHVGQVVGRVGHALGAGGHDDVGIPSDDGLRADNKGFDGRGADLVDGCGDGRLGQASANGTLAGGVLAETEGERACQEGGVEASVGLHLGEAYFAERTLPTKTSWTSSGLMPARSTAAGGAG